MTERALEIGFVNLNEDKRPKRNTEYEVVSASSDLLADLSYPDSDIKKMSVDLFKLYIDNLPDFTSDNEGLIKIQVDTRNPQDLDGETNDATFASEFQVSDGSHAPTFLYRGVFRNVLLRDWVNLRFDLYELDTDSSVYYEKIKSVLSNVPEINNLDVLKGIPYLNLATNLFEGVITTFGKNPDDHIWGEVPLLELEPIPGSAFLRTGIYVLFERINSEDQEIRFEDLLYVNGSLIINGQEKVLSNHLIFGIGLKAHNV